MRTNKHIHNLDTLEKELYRLQLSSKESAKKLKDDLEYLRENFFTLAKNSVKKEKKKEETQSTFFDSIFKNEHVRETVSGITNKITDHTAKAVSDLIDRLFQKHK